MLQLACHICELWSRLAITNSVAVRGGKGFREPDAEQRRSGRLRQRSCTACSVLSLLLLRRAHACLRACVPVCVCRCAAR